MSIKRVLVQLALASPALLPMAGTAASAEPATQTAGNFFVEAGVGYEHQGLPGFGYGKNYGGTHLANNDDDAKGLRWGLGVGYILGGEGWLGSIQRVAVRYSRLTDSSTASSAPAAPAVSFDPLVGIVSFDGLNADSYGGSPYLPGEETRTDVRMDYKNDEVSLSLEGDNTYGAGTTLTTSLALVVGRTQSDNLAHVSGRAASGIGALTQDSYGRADLDRKYAGPELSLGLTHDLGSGFSLNGGVRIAALVQQSKLSASDCADVGGGGDGICDGLVYQTSVSQTKTDLTYRGSLRAGLAYDTGPATLGFDAYAGLDRARMKIVTPHAVSDAAVHVDNETLTTLGGRLYLQIKF